MLILLPPSETKATRARGNHLALDGLVLPQLTTYREQVIDTLGSVSKQPDATRLLKLSPGLSGEVAHNRRLRSAPTLRAGDLYAGVLYDALGLSTLPAAGLRRAQRRVLVVSALFGALRLTDRVPPYRLSMGVSLPGVGPLAAHWRGPLGEHLPRVVGRGVIIDDCRSSTYAAAWAPAGSLTRRWVQIRVPGATHHAKHTRGLVVRTLCADAGDPTTPSAVAEQLATRFAVALTEPVTARGPWVLDVLPPHPQPQT